ncbi:uncharacterized protein LOC124276211 [Haliotis rubra]|uniref:uncharacterized protein LOC124276211 n=1 Tax=Haliotis rubra TaxID=36100 RepID=UPI001EE5EC8D|nr:uncharacterized protein LOC124276211 [Haliotis rubra]
MEGGDVTFMCKARAVGATSDLVTSWADFDSEATLSSDKSQVTFHNVSMGDNDCVHCSISNNIDYISKTACFRVVNDSSELPPTTTTTWAATTQIPPGKAHAPGSSSVGSLVAIIVVMLIIAVAASVGFLLWRRRQLNRVTFRVKKDDKATFEEKAKRRQTV